MLNDFIINLINNYCLCMLNKLISVKVLTYSDPTNIDLIKH